MNNFNIKEKKKLHNIFLVLSGLFITNAIIAEILGTKIFDVSIIKDFSLSVGVVIWPVVFITTDIINEYFGKKGVKKVREEKTREQVLWFFPFDGSKKTNLFVF